MRVAPRRINRGNGPSPSARGGAFGTERMEVISCSCARPIPASARKTMNRPLMSSSWKSVFILFLFGAEVGAAQSGEEILRESVAAHGGLERFRAIRDWRIVADRRLEGDTIVNEVYEEF